MDGRWRKDYVKFVSDEITNKISNENTFLLEDYEEWLKATGKSEKTTYHYVHDLMTFMCWNVKHNKNKFFVNVARKEFNKFEKFCLIELDWNTVRLKRMNCAISSLSNYILSERKEEFPDFENIILKIKIPKKEGIRTRTPMTDKDVELLLQYLMQKRKYEQACAIAISCYSDIRVSEMLQLRISSFNKDHLVLNGAFYRTDELKMKGGKKVNRYILRDVEKYVSAWRSQRLEMGVKSDFFFVTKAHDGRWVKRKDISSWNKVFTKILNGAPFYFSCLRSFCKIKMMRSGIPEKVVDSFFKYISMDIPPNRKDAEIEAEFGSWFLEDGVKREKTVNYKRLRERTLLGIPLKRVRD